MTVNSLQVLADNREALLLAEVAALLHDMGKSTSEFAYYPQARSVKVNNRDLDPYKAIFSDSELGQFQFSQQRLQERLDEARQKYALHVLLTDEVKEILDGKFTIENVSYSFREAIYFSRPRFATRIKSPLGRDAEPLDLLAYCHGEGHVEKEDPVPSITPQMVACYSAFGYLLDNLPKPDQPKSLTKRLNDLNWQTILQHNLEELRVLFLDALGDTRFPINEVTLWDWSYTVASLYKSEMARHFLTGEWRARDNIRWRLLRVNFDVLALYAKAVKIGDLLGYQRVVDEACEAVKKLVEEEYPLGNEVYRDTTGIYFTFPDLDLPADLAQEIRRRVEEVEMELSPCIAVTVGDGNTAAEQLKSILGKARGEALEALAYPFDSQNLSGWQQQWTTVGQGSWELCPVCRLRPKREDEQACQTCLDRRVPRVQEWLKNLSTTIWTDEVADVNGRLALIVGQFGLDDWLNGQLVQTLTVTEPKDGNVVWKNPSPARLRRIWETTRTFWQEVLTTEAKRDLQSLVGWKKRLAILPQNGVLQSVATGHTYDLIVNDMAVSVVWDGKRFLTADNLDYLAKPEQLGKPLEQLLRPGEKYKLEEPAGNGAKNKEVDEITIEKVAEINEPYLPAIPILAEPRTFMALVPADRALPIVQAIKCKYEREMGKVRNRLPLTLGVVYFGRRTPLAAALDAGRRMLRRKVTAGTWTVKSRDPLECLSDDWPRRVCLTLSDGFRSIQVEIPTVMGDNETKDVWYPYWRLEGDNITNRQRWFKGADGGIWVHVCDLRPGDRVHFMPSTFDYEYLDTTTRRFEIFYGEDGQRRGNEKPQRPYLLEELSDIQNVWKALQSLRRSQIYQIESLIEAKRRAWGNRRGRAALDLPSEDVFRRFVKDVLLEAQAYSQLLEKAALNGMLSDVLELYFTLGTKEAEHDQR